MPTLNLVFLDGLNITDEGLASPVAQPGLESIHVNGTAATSFGVDAFRAERPSGKLEIGPIQNSPYFSIR
jgi:hypothetical protein